MVKHVKGVDLSKLIKEIEQTKVKVGFFSNARYTNGDYVAMVAATNEYGSIANNIPPRPFMRPAHDKNKEVFAKAIASAVRNAKDGKATFRQGMGLFGEVAVGEVKQAIRDVTSPRLAKATIEARKARHSKGIASDKPLVDSGIMLQSVSYEVE